VLSQPEGERQITRGVTLTWEVADLTAAAADLPVEEVPVGELEHLLDEVVWFDADSEARDDKPTARAVAVHAERIYGAELEFPIPLASTGEVLDGMHRLAKAWMMGVETIKVRRFVVEPAPVWVEKVV